MTESHNRCESLRAFIDKGLRDEFKAISKWIILAVAVPVIWASGFNDYKIWGWQAFWVLTRLLYLPVAMVAVNLYRFKFFERHYELPSLIPTAYVTTFVTWFITLSGYEASPHIHGMNKLLLALSVLPYSVGSYVALLFLCNLLPILIIAIHYGSFHFYMGSQLSFLFSYSVMSVLVYCSVNFVRRKLYVTAAELAQQKQMQDHIIADQADKIARSRTAESIARTTQMLVHDIRKPFAMMQSVLRIIRDETNATALKAAAAEFLPEVEKSQKKVNAMLEDIILVGGIAKLHTTHAVFEEILATCISDVCRLHKGPHVAFAYHFSHAHKVKIDPAKISRVLENILLNALQAMISGGTITIETNENPSIPPLLGVRITNTGSYINPGDQPHIFDAFFTKGKRNGTGLGLAICKTIIEAHGGQIDCESSPHGVTSFLLTMPLSHEPWQVVRSDLPIDTLHAPSLLPAQAAHEVVTMHRLQALGRKLKLLFVDDEDVYRQAFRRLIHTLPDLHPHLDLTEASTANEATRLMAKTDPDVIIVDLDLENSSGLEVLAAAKSQNSQAFLCLHSNRSLMDLQQLVMENKANLFIPKPLIPEHFVKMLLDATLRLSENRGTTGPKIGAPCQPTF